MAFITIANAQSIIYKMDIKQANLKGKLYNRPIYFFSEFEKNSLLAIQELLKDPKKFFTEYYVPLKIKDTFTYVYEGGKPAYHKSIDCGLLRSNYQNFIIPSEIREQGQQKAKEFRNWFKMNSYLLAKPDVFVARLHAAWGIITNPAAINKDNTGWTEIENYDLAELEEKINSMVKAAGRYYYENDKNKTILRRYSKYTYLAYKKVPIRTNDTMYSDEEIKDFLKDYDNRFKKPLKPLLVEYYRLTLNPEIELDGYLLDKLNFKPCSKCYENGRLKKIDDLFEPINIDDALRGFNI